MAVLGSTDVFYEAAQFLAQSSQDLIFVFNRL